MNNKPILEKKDTVLLAMSGGTDSSVASIILKQQKYNIKGITFHIYDVDKKDDTECNNKKTLVEAQKLAKELGFSHKILNIQKEFNQKVIKNFIDQYLSGLTPNPCVVCNKTIKWETLLEEADNLNCKYLATGHYAQVVFEKNRYFIRKGKDKDKDQSYFLWTLSQKELSRTIFPLGNLTKNEVREIARQNNYEQLANKSESQEICFIPDNNYRNFLDKQIPDLNDKIGAGNYIDTSGKVIGTHKGYPFYTIGQRKGLNIAMGYPVYVKKIDSNTNTITLGKKDEILNSIFEISNINLMKYTNINSNIETNCKIRYNNKGEKCTIIKQEKDKIIIKFEKPVSAITPGQSAVIYEKDDLIAGGIISKILE